MDRRPPRGRASAVALGVWLAFSGCGGGAVEEGAVLAEDAPLGLSEAPVLVVGEHADDPDHELFGVVTPFLLPGGGIGVPLAGEGSIRIFDAQGAFVRTLGSSGQGPGEFVGLAAAWARGDTIEALDAELNRVTRFVPGASPETILLEGVASAQGGVPALDDGSWIRYGVKDVQRNGRDLIAVHRFAPDGSHVAELAQTRGFRRHVHDGGGGPDPISPRSLVRTDGNRVYVAETLTPRIEVIHVSTGESRAVRWEPERILGHAEAVAMAREAASDPARLEMGEAWTLASFRALSGNEEVPVFWDFLVDGGAFVWVRPYDPRVHATSVGGLGTGGAGGTWSVFDLEGRLVTSVTVPDDFEPTAIEGDHLIGVRRDALDVESVRVYRIERTGS